MPKSIFVSTVFEDSHRIESIKKWVLDGRLPDLQIIHELEDKRLEGKDAIKNQIKPKIQNCSVVFVLIGQDTHNHDWIRAEVELANSFVKSIICIRIPNTTGNLPPILSKYKTVTFDPDSIKRALEGL